MISLSTIEIREFQKGDRKKVGDFFANLGFEAQSFFNRQNGNLKSAMRFFDGDDSNCIRFMAESENEMVGYVFLWNLDYKIPWLGIAVADSAKGKGLGKRLIQKMIAYCHEKNKGGIFLTTHTANLRAQALYERYGFERLGMQTGTEIMYVLNFKEDETQGGTIL